MNPILDVPRSTTLAERIATREAKVGIVGLGYAGLPLALAFSEAGFEVTGIDLNEARVGAVQAGQSYLVDVPAERYADAQGRLSATTDYSAVAELDALTICVPTPLDEHRSPNLKYVTAAAESISRHLKPGALVVLQSTTFPGTTESLLLPIFESACGTVGEDFHLGYAPERVDPGNPRYNLRNTPKIAAGITDECRALTAALYATVVDEIVEVSSTTVAESVKLHENTFRQVNIALANELALMCDRLGINAWEVIDAAATKPFAFMAHYPGPGLGGDCIPVVPHFFTWRLREFGYSTRLIDAAHEINRTMPIHVVQKAADALNSVGRSINGARILLLGVAYKPNVHDTRESPSLDVMRDLIARGGNVRYCDPWVDYVELDGRRHASVAWTAAEVQRADVVVMLTPHADFMQDRYWARAPLIVDTRNVVPELPGVWRI